MSTKGNLSGFGQGTIKPGFCSSKSWCVGILSNAPILMGDTLGVGRMLLRKDDNPMLTLEYFAYRWAVTQWHIFKFCPFCGVNLYALYLADGRMQNKN